MGDSGTPPKISVTPEIRMAECAVLPPHRPGVSRLSDCGAQTTGFLRDERESECCPRACGGEGTSPPKIGQHRARQGCEL